MLPLEHDQIADLVMEVAAPSLSQVWVYTLWLLPEL
jgi:hypothetical protein